MSKNKHENTSRSHVSRAILIQYFISLAAVVAGLFALAALAQWICGLRLWYKGDGTYEFLLAIKMNLPTIFGIAVFIGWVIVTVIFAYRLLRYCDELAAAAKQLTSPSEQEITLKKPLREIELDLNAARVTALRNAERAREADQRKNDLIVYLAHDLKTPLTSVIGYLTLLRDEPELPPEIRSKYTGIALEKAERLEQLINEFFDITRFSLSTLTLEPERIDLSLMLEQTMNEFIPIFAEKNLLQECDIPPNIELLCDPDKLERVWDNLLKNAVNYSYADTAVSLKMTAENGFATVIIGNRGKTVPKEKLSRIFEQFFRLDSARQSSSGGAGLGLAIAKEIVELHGGRISAESENERIVFTVVLPLK